MSTVHTQEEFRTDQRHYTISFAPGYQDFIKNMTTDTLCKCTWHSPWPQLTGTPQLPSSTINLSRVRQVHDGVNKMNCNAADFKQGRYEETSN